MHGLTCEINGEKPWCSAGQAERTKPVKPEDQHRPPIPKGFNGREMMFKPGDKVVVIDGPQAGKKVHTLEARNSAEWCYPLLIDNHCYNSEGKRSWNEPVCLRHATPEEIAAAEKPLRRGEMKHTDRELLEQPAQQWIKCSERLPGKWENVLVYDGDYIVLAAFVDGMWMPASAALPLAGITHWMPLPQPPEDQQ